MTIEGLAALRTALPLAIAVQRRMFGGEGGPGGELLASLLRIEAQEAADTSTK